MEDRQKMRKNIKRDHNEQCRKKKLVGRRTHDRKIFAKSKMDEGLSIYIYLMVEQKRTRLSMDFVTAPGNWTSLFHSYVTNICHFSSFLEMNLHVHKINASPIFQLGKETWMDVRVRTFIVGPPRSFPETLTLFHRFCQVHKSIDCVRERRNSLRSRNVSNKNILAYIGSEIAPTMNGLNDLRDY